MADLSTPEGKLVERLKPAWVIDEPAGEAVSILRRIGGYEPVVDALNRFIVANNALKSEAADALSRIAADRDEAIGKLALLIDRVVYTDSYGVPGSDFAACCLCDAGGAPGVPLEHKEHCPVRQLGVIAEGWFEADRERDQALDEQAARASAAERERDELKAALKPFVAVADAIDDVLRTPDDKPAWTINDVPLMWGDFRRARAALRNT